MSKRHNFNASCHTEDYEQILKCHITMTESFDIDVIKQELIEDEVRVKEEIKVEADPFAYHFDQEETDEERVEAPTETGTMLSQLPPYYYQSYAPHMTSPQRNKRKSVPRKVLVQPSTDEDTEVTTNDIQSTEGKTRKRGRKKYEKLFPCEYCDKIYSIKAKLVVHTRMHTGERPYGCSVCSKMFRTRGTAISHENSHLGLKPYACELCDKSYTSNQQLKIHIRSHTGERPYACAVCQKDFKDRWKLTLHVQTHTGLRPYACDKCDKKYTTKYQLTTHYRLHTREKLFECEVCTRQFVERCKLEKHRKIHLGLKPFRCAICDKNYRQKSHLKFHIESAHSDIKS